jgi:hypothetical protein
VRAGRRRGVGHVAAVVVVFVVAAVVVVVVVGAVLVAVVLGSWS